MHLLGRFILCSFFASMRRMKFLPSLGLVTVSLLFASSCTVSNPLYAGNGTNNDLGIHTDGGNSLADLAHLGPSPDLALPPACVASERSCTHGTVESSMACVAGQVQTDRACLSSTCADGYCVAPDQPAGSQLGADCAFNGDPNDANCQFSGGMLACQPFVTDPQQGGVDWFCAPAVGQGNSGASCTKSADCRSGFCGSNGTCFRACGSDFDCPVSTSTGQRYHCSKVSITVEGVRLTDFRSCVP